MDRDFDYHARYSASNDNNEREDKVEISIKSNGKGRNSGGKKRPMDLFCRNPTAVIERKKKRKTEAS